MATQPKLVNKQFNSPIGLYSEQNIRDVIQRESQILANGAVGINFNNPGAGKPSNLQNSAVLRMLEEEEIRQRNGHSPGNGYDYSRPLRDQIKWPPPEFEHKNILKATFKDVVTPGLKRVAWPPPHEGELLIEQSPTQSQPQGGPQYTPQPQNNYASAPQAVTNNYPLKPLDISTASSLSSASPIANQSPSGFRPATPSKQWAPVTSPLAHQNQPPQYQQYQQSPPQYQQPQSQYQQSPQSYQQPQPQYQGQSYQPPQQQYQQPYQPTPQGYQSAPQGYQSAPQGYSSAPQGYQSAPQGYSSAPQGYQSAPQGYPSGPQSQYSRQTSTQSIGAPSQVVQPRPAAKHVEPPPTTITLRKEAPVRQAPPPVVTSQPATATLKGGKNLRGDLKWPPENVRQRMSEEDRLLLELAKGPACRPTLKRKDYTPFFEQHALNSAYPGYKIPPGTQFYEHNPRY